MKSKLSTILLSAVFALAIWLYVITVVSPNSDKYFGDISVKIDDAVLHDRGLTVTNKEGHVVSLHVEGNRIDLKSISNDDFRVTVDLSRVYKAGTHNLPCEVELRDASEKNVSITKVTPGTISINVEAYISEKIPVKVEYTGQLDEFHNADKENVSLDYNEFWITGPASSVENVAYGRVVVDLTEKVESISENYSVELCDKDGKVINDPLIQYELREVKVNLKIQRFKVVPIQFKSDAIKPGGGATLEDCLIAIEPKSIMIYGSDSRIGDFDDVYDIGEPLDLATIEDGFTRKYPINLPADIKTGTSEVTVTITFPNLATEDFTITNIVAINQPEGLNIDVKTTDITLRFRGPRDKILSLKSEDIRLEVDCANVKLEDGVTQLTPQISGVDPAIGALTTDEKVSIHVTEAVPEPDPAELTPEFSGRH